MQEDAHSQTSQESPERTLQVVLSVLSGEASAVEIARRAGVAEQTVYNWKNAFLEAGRAGLLRPSGAGRRGSRNSTRRTKN